MHTLQLMYRLPRLRCEFCLFVYSLVSFRDQEWFSEHSQIPSRNESSGEPDDWRPMITLSIRIRTNEFNQHKPLHK